MYLFHEAREKKKRERDPTNYMTHINGSWVHCLKYQKELEPSSAPASPGLLDETPSATAISHRGFSSERGASEESWLGSLLPSSGHYGKLHHSITVQTCAIRLLVLIDCVARLHEILYAAEAPRSLTAYSAKEVSLLESEVGTRIPGR